MSVQTQREIVRILRPFIESEGFQATDEEEEEAVTLDFRRVIKPDWHFLSLQFDTHGRDRFVLEAGKCTDQGVTYFGEHFRPDRVTPAHLFLRARLQPRPGHSTSSWFRADSWLDLFRSNRGPQRVLGEVQSLFPEIDRWLRTGQAGNHVQVMDLAPVTKKMGKEQA